MPINFDDMFNDIPELVANLISRNQEIDRIKVQAQADARAHNLTEEEKDRLIRAYAIETSNHYFQNLHRNVQRTVGGKLPETPEEIIEFARRRANSGANVSSTVPVPSPRRGSILDYYRK